MTHTNFDSFNFMIQSLCTPGESVGESAFFVTSGTLTDSSGTLTDSCYKSKIVRLGGSAQLIPPS